MFTKIEQTIFPVVEYSHSKYKDTLMSAKWWNAPPPDEGDDALGSEEIRDYLLKQNKETLVDLLVMAVERDNGMYNRILLRIANTKPGGPDLAALKFAIEQATEIDDYIDEEESWGYSEKWNDIVESIRELLVSGHPDHVIDIVEYASELIENQTEQVDDSFGSLDMPLFNLEALYLEAFKQCTLPLKNLGERLFKMEMRSDFVFEDALNKYDKVLGEEGVEAYSGKAKKEWDKLPELKPGDNDKNPDKRWRLTKIMKLLARRSGDINELIAVLRKDLSSSNNYYNIVEACQLAGEDEKALEWAERGIQSFPNLNGSRIPDILITLYHDQGRHSDVMNLIWRRFESAPSLHFLKPLKEYSVDNEEWLEWCDRAFAHARNILLGRRSYSFTRSELVRMLLWDNKVEEAWIEANKDDNLPVEVWLNVADARADTNPDEAIVVYRKIVNRMLSTVRNGKYDNIIPIVCTIRDLYKRVGRDNDLETEIDRLRQTYKSKRKFISELDRINK